MVYALVGLHNFINKTDTAAAAKDIPISELKRDQSNHFDGDGDFTIQGGSKDMNELRDSIAKAMWEDYLLYRRD